MADGFNFQESGEERKMRKRSAAIEAIQRTPAYIVSATQRWAELPSTPVPDITLSKRTWERVVMKWRAALRLCLRAVLACQLEALEDVK